MSNENKDNPFYDNHIFSEFDFSRVKIRKMDWLWLWFFPTYVQIGDGYAFYYKIVKGAYYFINVKKI